MSAERRGLSLRMLALAVWYSGRYMDSLDVLAYGRSRRDGTRP